MEGDQFPSGSWSVLVSQPQNYDLPTRPRSARSFINYTRDAPVHTFDASRGEPISRLSRKCGKDGETFFGRLTTPAGRKLHLLNDRRRCKSERKGFPVVRGPPTIWESVGDVQHGRRRSITSVSRRWAVQGGGFVVGSHCSPTG
jgi:hypothetical protein